jgi:DNA modification methylase
MPGSRQKYRYAYEATGRRWIGIEMDEGFCEAMKERLKGLA